MDKKIKTPIRAIRENCIECSGGSFSEVRHCVIHMCPLYPYRMGKRPAQVDIDTHIKSYDEKQ